MDHQPTQTKPLALQQSWPLRKGAVGAVGKPMSAGHFSFLSLIRGRIRFATNFVKNFLFSEIK